MVPGAAPVDQAEAPGAQPTDQTQGDPATGVPVTAPGPDGQADEMLAAAVQTGTVVINGVEYLTYEIDGVTFVEVAVAPSDLFATEAGNRERSDDELMVGLFANIEGVHPRANWGFVSFTLNEGQPLEDPGPSMVIDSRLSDDYLLDGQRIKLALVDRGSLTKQALEITRSIHQEEFGSDVPQFYTSLADQNLKNFQREYAQRVAHLRGYEEVPARMSHEEAVKDALSNISAGRHRLKMGYSEWKTNAGPLTSKVFTIQHNGQPALIEADVPESLEFWARQPPKGKSP